MLKRLSLVAIFTFSVLLARGLADGTSPSHKGEGQKPMPQPKDGNPPGKPGGDPPPAYESKDREREPPPRQTEGKPETEGKTVSPPEPISEKHYRIYDGKGNPVALDAVLKQMHSADVIFLGEHHD